MESMCSHVFHVCPWNTCYFSHVRGLPPYGGYPHMGEHLLCCRSHVGCLLQPGALHSIACFLQLSVSLCANMTEPIQSTVSSAPGSSTDLWPLPDVSLPHEVLLVLREFLPREHFANVHSACVYEQESWEAMIRDVAELEQAD